MAEIDFPDAPAPASDTMLRLEQAMEKYAPAGHDPASDDLTIPFAMELVEKDRQIAALREALKPFAERGQSKSCLRNDLPGTFSGLSLAEFRLARDTYEQIAAEIKR